MWNIAAAGILGVWIFYGCSLIANAIDRLREDDAE